MELMWRYRDFTTAVLILILALCNGKVRRIPLVPSIPATTCGYNSCHEVDPNKLNVHLVAHTHDDVGWLKTVDEYFYGLKNYIQNANVTWILDSATDALLANPERRFIYVETVYFWRWWLEQTPERQLQIKDLVSQGRLEFIGGGWSMNDEATTHYDAIIDQFTWALRKLNDTFGVCGRPHVGWQIDPFGHSREMASIFARMGYDGLFFTRLDYQDKDKRLESQTAELIWEGSANLDEAGDIFTSIIYGSYYPPDGFCFDITCGYKMNDNTSSPSYNVDNKVREFVKEAAKHSRQYTTNHILFTMGGDFLYQKAEVFFENLDKLVKYVNAANKSVNVLYSTPSCYLKAVNDEGKTYTTKQDDFFPYIDDYYDYYWTGYYTSRPTLKYFERLANNFLQVTKQLVAMTELGQEDSSPIDSLREAMGVLQHHDAITGTEQQHVANDYAKTLSEAIEDAREAAEIALNQLMSSNGNNAVEVFNCLRLNVSACDITETEDRFVVTVYNPLSHEVTHFVRLPVIGGTYKVQGPDATTLVTQMVPIPPEVIAAPERENSTATHDLVFKAENLPPLGFRSYYVTKISSCFEDVEKSSEPFIGKKFQVFMNETTGLMKGIKSAGTEIPIQHNFYYYDTSASGAYVFDHIGRRKPITNQPNITIYKGPVVDEVHQTFSNWASQVIRVYHEENNAELEWLIGPILLEYSNGKEVLSGYTSDLASHGTFYTDSNGRELLERKRDSRPTPNIKILDHIAGNYYPVTSRILIKDETKGLELSLLNDRAQGGSSILDGDIELMLHRRLVNDDAKGVCEELDETAYGKGLLARGRHYLVAGPRDDKSPNLDARARLLAQKNLLQPWLFFLPGGSSFRDWQKNYKMEYSGLKTSLPLNIKILTLEPWRNHSLLLRLEHIMEKNEDEVLSQPVDISFKDIFTKFTVTSFRETPLAANQWIEEVKTLKWKYDRRERQGEKCQHDDDKLRPMEIKTYVINVQKR
ncbi:lysosomal alpha-mannosidase-like [Periplaneta americana]|uniref:lysosomal alpha-mannosidase-like n=1 Tax=Periplaneta americana TaxID=6978 RepID=UPI0037E75345